jgi:serine/threonine protein kinase/Leucine-rich repeat (LRR) protein
MAVALDSIVKQLTESGIIAPGKLQDFVPPKANPKNVEELMAELLKQNCLTAFQAKQIAAGKAKALVLGNYLIADKIGAGGMGQVFKAEHRRMHRTVAIKMLPPAMVKDPAALARFEREVTAAAKLTHPNIVGAFDADEANGVHFLVMEYVEGQDLSALVKKNGPMSVANATNYVLQAAKGLAFAHAEGVVHRDIKPANLLLDKKGTVKILDMGLARVDGLGGVAQAELTTTGAVMGTVDYMAPEQALNTKYADQRADIYSLGITLFYLITGRAAYGGDSIMEKLLAHREQPIPSLKELQPTVSDRLEAIYETMVAKKADDRYQSMSEVVLALEALAPGASTSSVTSDAAFTWSPSAEDRARLAKQPSSKSATHGLKGLAKTVAAEKTKYFFTKVIGGSFATIIAPIMVFYVIKHLDKDPVPPAPAPVATATAPATKAPAVNQVATIPSSTQHAPSQTPLPLAASGRKPGEGVPRWNTPAFQQWVKATQALPAEKQIEAVSKKLMELNPGFDGKLTGSEGKGTPTIKNGVVMILNFRSDDISDISPVRALVGLKFLGCAGTSQSASNLFDLSPLEGMPLEGLDCHFTQVSDLSPIQGMPLGKLYCHNTNVLDLTPLEGMPLKTLECDQTSVSDLSPLAGMNLTELRITPKNITKGMDVIRQMRGLTYIGFGRATKDALPPAEFWKRYDAGEFGKPVAGANLAFTDSALQQWVKSVQALPAEKQLAAFDKKFREYNPEFKGQVSPKIDDGAVTELRISGDGIMDIAPVRVFSRLTRFSCYGGSRTSILSDLSPLAGLPLTAVSVTKTMVTDLSPLKGMQLTSFGCEQSDTDDLSPLAGMPLVTLRCGASHVADLSPLRGMPIEQLTCDTPYVTDLSPLEGMPLTEIAFTPSKITRGIDVIRNMKSIKKIGTSGDPKTSLPAADFWKKYDAGAFGPPQVSRLPPGGTPPAAAAQKPAAASSQPQASSPTQIERLTSADYEWSKPESLGPTVNATRKTSSPTLTEDQLRLLVFQFGNSGDKTNGLHEYRRPTLDAPWGDDVLLNNSSGVGYPSLSSDGLLLFANIAQGTKHSDLEMRTRPTRDAPWGQPTKIASLNTEESEYRPVIAPDGLSLVFGSNRAGGVGGLDLWISRRADLKADWQPPVHLGNKINSSKDEQASQILTDGKTILVNRDGDLFLAAPDAQGTYDLRPVPLPPKVKINKCWLSPDGATLYIDDKGGIVNDNEVRLIRRVAKASSLPSPLVGEGPGVRGIPTAALPFNGHRYLLVEEQLTWEQADAKARAMGGHLATITDKNEDEFVRKQLLAALPDERLAWIGAQKPQEFSAWAWVTGEPWSYSAWLPGEGTEKSRAGAAIVKYADKGLKGLGWGDWTSSRPPTAISGPLLGQDRSFGFVVEWDTLVSTAPTPSGPAIGAKPIAPVAGDVVFNGHRYRFVDAEAIRWDAAGREAEKLGGHLASITSQAEYDAVKKLFVDRLTDEPRLAWLGGSRSNNEAAWKWPGDEPWGYTAWLPQEPNQSKNSNARLACRFIKSEASGWSDEPYNRENSVAGYVVEWDTLGQAANLQAIDLLAAIDPVKHKQQGVWKKDDTGLTSPASTSTAIKLPVVPTESYHLDLLVTRLSGTTGLSVGLVVGGSDARLFLDASIGDKPNTTALSHVNGKKHDVDGYDAPVARKPVFLPQVPTSVQIDVTPGTIVVTSAGKKIWEWSGSASSLSIGDVDRGMYATTPGTLWLGTLNGEYQIGKLSYTPLGAPAQTPVVDAPGSQKPSSIAELLTSPDYVWTEPENLGATVNGPDEDGIIGLTNDELRLYFRTKNAAGAYPEFEAVRGSKDEPFGKAQPSQPMTTDAYVSGDGLSFVGISRVAPRTDHDISLQRRTSLTARFDKPIDIGAEVNSTYDERRPTLSPDGLWLLFSRVRGEGKFGRDLWISRRKSQDAPFEPSTNAGPAVNSPDVNISAGVMLGDGQTILYRRSGQFYFATVGPNGIDSAQPLKDHPFGGDSSDVVGVWFSPDGRTAYFNSTRPGGQGNKDIWVTRRMPKR